MATLDPRLYGTAMCALDAVGDGVLTLSKNSEITYLNPAARRMLGANGDEFMGQRLDGFVTLEPDRAGSSLFEQDGPERAPRFHPDAQPMVLIRRNQRLPVDTLRVPYTDNKSVEMLVLHDRSAEVNLRKSIANQARTDKLTGLLNRHELDRCLANLIEDAESASHTHALLYIDLDQFKVVNDTCGHQAGDEMLRLIAAQLSKVVQKNDIVGRLGGDEFAVLICHVDASAAIEVAERICRAIRQVRFAWGGYSFSAGASIGVTIIDEMTRTSATAMRQVDSACYAAKDHGRNRVHLYTESDRDMVQRHGEMQWLSKINHALDDNRLRIVQQRIAPLQPGMTGDMAELLMRIEMPDGQLIAPGAFIPAAERYNLMPQLDRWVIQHVIDTLALPQFRTDSVERYAINLSGLSIGDPNFLSYILDVFSDSSVPASRICFEITETAAVASFSKAVRFMGLLREIGCQFALDDFGSGMSSFGYLRELPVDYLKIDGMFITDLEIDPFHRAIVRSINEVDHAAGMKTIAEHVDSASALRLLTEMGVDYVQGFFIAKPLPFGVVREAA